MMDLPLKGLVVLEFSQYLSCPSAGLKLADLGARVIKIERLKVGDAGRKQEKDIEADKNTASTFSLAKGLPLCLLAGVLSALYGFSLDQGQPIADIASKYGAGNFQGNVVYIFSNSGAFVTAFFYCLYLHNKEKTFGQYASSGNSNLS